MMLLLFKLKRAGAIILGVEFDCEGILPESLRNAMENWKEQLAAHGVDGKKVLGPPKLLYTIPTGQNPTGIVISLKRKKEIYKVIV